MSIARAEFLLRLPAAVGGDGYVEEGASLVHREPGGRTWTIILEAMPELRIALLRMERWRVCLRFENYDAATIQRFLQRFHLYFRRGGG